MRIFFLSLFVLAAAGCDDTEPLAGAAGGACRFGDMPCDPGLACQNGACEPVEADAGPTRPRLAVEFNLADDRVPADGESRLAVDFTAAVVEDDGSRTPYEDDGQSGLFLTPIPSEAGRVVPGRPVVVGGLAIVEFIPCDRATAAVCPDSAIIRLAHDDAPTTAIADSPRFLLIDPPRARPDAGADPSN